MFLQRLDAYWKRHDPFYQKVSGKIFIKIGRFHRDRNTWVLNTHHQKRPKKVGHGTLTMEGKL